MLLSFEDGRPFAHGACPFVYRPATERETVHRIFVPVQIEGIQTEAVVDTGGVYLVWNLPSFMGLSGCLERIRFAVDSATDTFYFGAIDEGD